MKRNSCLIIILLMIVLAIFSIELPRRPRVSALAQSVNSSAKCMCVIEAESARKLYSKNEMQKVPMASTTKIVTALTVLNNCDNLDKEFEIDPRAVGVEGTSIYLKRGESLTVRELLYGMMLPSGNDAATALAYHISSDMSDFCQ